MNGDTDGVLGRDAREKAAWVVLCQYLDIAIAVHPSIGYAAAKTLCAMLETWWADESMATERSEQNREIALTLAEALSQRVVQELPFDVDPMEVV